MSKSKTKSRNKNDATRSNVCIDNGGRDVDWRPVVIFAGFFLFALAIYSPALRGTLLWDDAAHVTRPDLQSLDGLARIWFDPKATQQYYPLLHSAFWLEHRLWGDNTLGYHLANVILHSTAAWLAYLALRRLAVPGAFLAALLFLVHPVHVESVAWITEQKNTLSAVFYLASLCVYLQFDDSRRTSRYVLALVLFVLALLTKTVTATLPAALLVIFWWQRGTLSWKRDVVPLLPFFAIGAFAGISTALVERYMIGADGPDFELTIADRLLLAGRVPWFYLSKLVWPNNLLFFYPRWQVDPKVWWQWLFPLATLSTLAVLVVIRARWRGPLAAALLFLGTLFPALGFLNVYPFLFSFVADHFQYLASLSVLTAIAAGGVVVFVQSSDGVRRALQVAAVGVVGTLTAISWQQSHLYVDVETLYLTTVERNPAAWLAWHNIGVIRNEQGRPREAIEVFDRVVSLKPSYPSTYLHKGMSYVLLGKVSDAIPLMRRSIELRPNLAEAHNNLASALDLAGDVPGAIEHYQIAASLLPYHAQVRGRLGATLIKAGDLSAGIEVLQQAVELDPDNGTNRRDLAQAWFDAGQAAHAIEQAQAAIRLHPTDFQALNILGAALGTERRYEEAAAAFQEAARIQPQLAQAKCNLMFALAAVGKRQEAIECGETALAQAQANGETALAERIQSWLTTYRSEQP